MGARKELDRIFEKAKLKLGGVEKFGGETEQDEEKNCLAVTVVSVHATDLIAMMDYRAIPNMLPSAIARRLSLDLEQCTKTVTVTDGSTSSVEGKLSKVSVMLDLLVVKMDFVVMQNVPFDLVIGRPTLKRLIGVLNLRTKEVRLHYQSQQATLPTVSEYSCARDATGSTDSEDFTLDSDEQNDNKSVEEGTKGEELVHCLRGSETSAWVDQISCSAEDRLTQVRSELNKKLGHLLQRMAEEISGMMISSGVVACSLRDPRPASVPLQHFFELNDESPVYHCCRRMPPKYNEIVKKELWLMLEAGIVTPSSSARSFPVVIATKKDGKPRFCVEYRVPNQRMKPDRFSLPKIQEIFD